MNDDDFFEQTLRQLSQVFASELPNRLAEVEAALEACRDPQAYGQSVQTLHRLLHTLAGSAGTFGYPEIGLRFRTLQATAAQWKEAGMPAQEDINAMAVALDGVRQEVGKR